MVKVTLPQNATSNGGDASRVGKRCSYYLLEFVFPSHLRPDARRVANSGSVWCLSPFECLHFTEQQ